MVNAPLPAVSVVIPSYNASIYISRTLDSVRAQSFKDIEILVINDGSTDDTGAIAARAAAEDARIRVITTSNEGVAAARNRGLDEARGRCVAFVDADDLWHPLKIERQMQVLDGLGPEWGGVYTLHEMIDSQDRVTAPGRSLTASGYIYARHIVFQYIGNGSTLLVRTALARALDGYDSSFARAGKGGCEDLDFELKLIERFKVAGIAERLVGYRHYPGNMSSDRRKMGLSALEAVNRSLARMPRLGARARKAALCKTWEYATLQFLRAGEMKLAAGLLAKLAPADPELVARLLAHHARSRLRALTRPAHEAAQGPRFGTAALQPVPPQTLSRRQRKLMALLEAEDRALEAGLGFPAN